MPHRTVQPANRAFAKGMRRAMTEPEFRLWWRLRKPGLEGLRFRRQVPVGPFIVDFFCAQKRLIVEIDGSQHDSDRDAARDAERTAWLQANGYRVVRFWNDDVLSNVDGVCDAILAAVAR